MRASTDSADSSKRGVRYIFLLGTCRLTKNGFFYHIHLVIMDDPNFNSRFVFHLENPHAVEDRKYNRTYNIKPKVSFVVLTDSKNNEYVRDSYGDKITSNDENTVLASLKDADDYGIQVINLENTRGCFKMDTKMLFATLTDLNKLLQKKCPALSLRFGMTKRLPGNLSVYRGSNGNDWALCLYYEGDCVSSIKVKLNENNTKIEISSMTHRSHRKKSYNKILRSALVIIGSHILCEGDDTPRAKVIQSVAINPISAWSLMSTFDGTLMTLAPIPFEGYKTDVPLKERIFSFYKEYPAYPFILGIPLNRNNIDKALDLFKNQTHKNSEWGC